MARGGGYPVMTLFQAFGQFAGAAAGEEFDFELIASQTVSGVSSVIFDNVFTSTYDHYFIIPSVSTVSAAGLDVTMRAGGSDNTSAVYARQALAADNTSVTAARTGAGTLFNAALGFASTVEYCSGMAFIQAPALANRTGITNQSSGAMDGNLTLNYRQFCHDSATVFDGIKITTSSNMTGTIRLYGWRA